MKVKNVYGIGKNISKQIVYKADLQRVGSIIDESLKVLSEYNRLNNWERTKECVISQNLLGKRSSQTVQGILTAIYKRFFSNYELPSIDILAKAIAKNISKIIKIQLLYPYICESDLLVKNLILNLVSDRINRSLMVLTKSDVMEFLEKEQKFHPELKKWSDYLKGRWVRGFLALLRDFNIMEKAPSYKLIKPLVRTETFAFFMLGLLEKNLKVKEIFQNEIWSLYFLKNYEVENFLSDMQAHGWIYYSRAGEIIELKPKFKLEEWLNGLE